MRASDWPFGLFAAIDFGISNSDVLVWNGKELTHTFRPNRGDPTSESVIDLLRAGGADAAQLERLVVTGGRHRLLPEQVAGRPVIGVGELEAIGRGGRALAELESGEPVEELLVVSAGSGAAMIAVHGDEFNHVTGTGVGGGTMQGLARLLLDTVDPLEIDALALRGDANGADLAIRDVVQGPIGTLPPDATAVNFGRLARVEERPSAPDLAASLVVMVAQVIATLAITAARSRNLTQTVVTGHLTDMRSVRRQMARVGDFYGHPLTLPPNAGKATALGALVAGFSVVDPGLKKE